MNPIRDSALRRHRALGLLTTLRLSLYRKRGVAVPRELVLRICGLSQFRAERIDWLVRDMLEFFPYVALDFDSIGKSGIHFDYLLLSYDFPSDTDSFALFRDGCNHSGRLTYEEALSCLALLSVGSHDLNDSVGGDTNMVHCAKRVTKVLHSRKGWLRFPDGQPLADRPACDG